MAEVYIMGKVAFSLSLVLRVFRSVRGVQCSAVGEKVRGESGFKFGHLWLQVLPFTAAPVCCAWREEKCSIEACTPSSTPITSSTLCSDARCCTNPCVTLLRNFSTLPMLPLLQLSVELAGTNDLGAYSRSSDFWWYLTASPSCPH
jgi:hypothetical protein